MRKKKTSYITQDGAIIICTNYNLLKNSFAFFKIIFALSSLFFNVIYGSVPGENLILSLYSFTSISIIAVSNSFTSKKNTILFCFCVILIIFFSLHRFFILAISNKFSSSFGIFPYLSVISSITSCMSSSVFAIAIF